MSLSDISDEEELLNYFPDIADGAVKCKFRNCEHAENSKGCWFQTLKLEDHSSAVVFSRLESYIRIRLEITQIPTWEKK
jgi:putative ribosome biogenesis GTPase RsgA